MMKNAGTDNRLLMHKYNAFIAKPFRAKMFRAKMFRAKMFRFVIFGSFPGSIE
jgi:hypothetical protein